jgi:diguanylate cyclase (GGDEF)-like protein
MQRGQFRVEVPADGADELGRLGRALQSLAESLEVRFDEIARLARITERINAGLVLEDILGELYQTFRAVIPYDRIGLALLEEDDQIVRARWARSEAAEIKLGPGYAAKLPGTSLEGIIQSGEPRILNDLEAHLEDNPSSESTRLIVAEGLRSSLTCPLVALGKPIGFLFFSSCEKNAYREIHQGYFMQLANQVSIVLERSRLYEETLDLNRRLRATQRTLQHEASHDALTGLWNRRAVLQLLERELAWASREGLPLTVIMLDLDLFKLVNDEHGHLVGDEVLREVARRLTASLRSFEFFGRLGGEEFLAILSPGDQATAELVMERARLACAERPFTTAAGELPITVSLGAVIVGEAAGVMLTDVLGAADRALYAAKAGGRNRWELETLSGRAQ